MKIINEQSKLFRVITCQTSFTFVVRQVHDKEIEKMEKSWDIRMIILHLFTIVWHKQALNPSQNIVNIFKIVSTCTTSFTYTWQRIHIVWLSFIAKHGNRTLVVRFAEDNRVNCVRWVHQKSKMCLWQIYDELVWRQSQVYHTNMVLH